MLAETILTTCGTEWPFTKKIFRHAWITTQNQDVEVSTPPQVLNILNKKKEEEKEKKKKEKKKAKKKFL